MRRKGRTILTLTGLAIGVALVIVISSLTQGLDDAQKTALNPLSSIGTDLTVTLAPAGSTQTGGGAANGGVTNGGAFAGGGFGGGGGGGFGGGGFGGGGRELIQANSAAITDLSKLGKPGLAFRPGLLPARNAAHVPGRPGEADRRSQRRRGRLDGPRPQRRPPGGDGAEDHCQAEGRRAAAHGHGARPLPVSAAEQAKVRACVQKLVTAQTGGTGQTGGAGTTGGAAGGAAAGGGSRLGGAGGGAGALGGAGGSQGAGGRGGFGGFDRSAFASACRRRPGTSAARSRRRSRRSSRSSPRPRRTSRARATRLRGSTRPSRRSGSSRPRSSRRAASSPPARRTRRCVANTYASRQGLKVGSTLDLNRTNFKVVGLVKPPLGGQSADVYVPLPQLQKLASQKALANVVLVRAKSGHVRRKRAAGSSRSSIRTRRSRARRTWPTRSAARS